ncbi:MAG: precorrin-6A reductase [Lachnospiraceae bacterium]|nr:precorrin-6A reductase [Lachnospiraceae bacterium]
MKDKEKIILFAGTSEGRRLSEKLSSYGISHIVSVATDYGKSLLGESHFAKVIEGRLDEPAMEELFINEKITVVADATHPYAIEVTANLKKAAERTGVKYLRLAREKLKIPSGAELFFDNESCADHLENAYRSGLLKGNVLITTGSKELSVYACREELRHRLYVRIIPDEKSFEICRNAEIKTDHIIAMQGPFSEELNSAIIREFGIDALVTKESGTAGGFAEKIRAAVNNDIKLCVIARPDEDGIGEDEMFRLLTGIEGLKDGNVKDCRGHISLIGAGPYEKDLLTIKAGKMIEEADYIIGAESIIAPFKARIGKKAAYLPGDIIPYIKDLLNDTDADELNIAVLFSGDSGFFSGCGKCYAGLDQAIRSGDIDAEITVLPGISSVSYMSSLLGVSYDTAGILSVHGRDRQEGLAELLKILEEKKRCFMLVSGDEDVRITADYLMRKGFNDCRITAGCSLSVGGKEEIRKMTADTAVNFSSEGKILLYIES